MLEERDLTVDEYSMLRASVGWYPMSMEVMACGLKNSLYSVVAKVEDEIIGCGRVVGDGGMYFYIQDVIVLPEHQGRGIGVEIMDRLMSYLDRNAKPTAFIGLMAGNGVAPFYHRYGFTDRPKDGPGMHQVRQ